MKLPYSHRYTPEELSEEYVFKLIKRSLIKDFDWIIDVIPPFEANINEFYFLFLQIVINPYRLGDEIDAKLNSYIFERIKRPHPAVLMGDGKYVYGSIHPANIYDIPFELGSKIRDEVDNEIKSISDSRSIPDELKPKKDRGFKVGEFLVPVKEIVPIPFGYKAAKN